MIDVKTVLLDRESRNGKLMTEILPLDRNGLPIDGSLPTTIKPVPNIKNGGPS